MIASGIVPTAIAGRMRCWVASTTSVPVPLQHPVEDLEVGDELEDAVAAEPPLLVERRGTSPGDRRPDGGRARHVSFSVTAKRYCSKQPEHEDRHRHAGVGDDHRADVGGGVAPVGGDHAERHADDDGERQRHDRQLDRRRQPLDEHLGDGSALGERLAEVAVEQVAEVPEELHDDRLVEPVALGERVADLVRRPLAEGRPARVARDDPGEDEHRGDDAEQHRDRRQQAVDDEADHANETGGGLLPAPRLSSDLRDVALTPRRRAAVG